MYNAENRLSLVQMMNTGTGYPNANASAIANVSATWQFVYDGDGNRVEQVYTNGLFTQGANVVVTSYFAGGAYEVHGQSTVNSDNTTFTTPSSGASLKYYAFSGQTVAMIQCTWTLDGNGNPVDACPTSGSLNYFLTDHLGSVEAVLDASGTVLSEQRYLPYGQVRSDMGSITQTDFGYTGQRNNSYINLMDYNSR